MKKLLLLIALPATVLAQGYLTLPYTDRSGTLGASWTSVMAANPYRHGCQFQNPNATHDMTIRINGVSQIFIAHNGGYYLCPATGITSQTIEATGTNGDAFNAAEW